MMNSINWPASSVWVFIAQLGEHCSANAEATGSNPVEAPKILFSGYFRNCLNCDSLPWSHTHFIGDYGPFSMLYPCHSFRKPPKPPKKTQFAVSFDELKQVHRVTKTNSSSNGTSTPPRRAPEGTGYRTGP